MYAWADSHAQTGTHCMRMRAIARILLQYVRKPILKQTGSSVHVLHRQYFAYTPPKSILMLYKSVLGTETDFPF